MALLIDPPSSADKSTQPQNLSPTPSPRQNPSARHPDVFLIRAHPRALISKYARPGLAASRHSGRSLSRSLYKMSPIVLESPLMNFHQNNIGTLSRMQLSPHNSPNLDSFAQDSLHIHPSLRPPSAQPNDLSFSPSGHPILDQGLRNGSTSSLNSGDPSAAPVRCTNCSSTSTPQWRRDGDGKPICNACGEPSSLSFPSPSPTASAANLPCLCGSARVYASFCRRRAWTLQGASWTQQHSFSSL